MAEQIASSIEDRNEIIRLQMDEYPYSAKQLEIMDKIYAKYSNLPLHERYARVLFASYGMNKYLTDKLMFLIETSASKNLHYIRHKVLCACDLYRFDTPDLITSTKYANEMLSEFTDPIIKSLATIYMRKIGDGDWKGIHPKMYDCLMTRMRHHHHSSFVT